jgi:putative flippase GtrA
VSETEPLRRGAYLHEQRPQVTSVSWSRFVRFAAVGVVATCVQYALLILLVRFAGMGATLASSLGFVASAAANYLLNYRYTFRSRHPHGPAMLKFASLASVGLLLNAGLMRLLTESAWNYLIAQVLATAVVLVWNFLGNSLWTFGRQSTSAP